VFEISMLLNIFEGIIRTLSQKIECTLPE
jgi:hypothetical protein